MPFQNYSRQCPLMKAAHQDTMTLNITSVNTGRVEQPFSGTLKAGSL